MQKKVLGISLSIALTLISTSAIAGNTPTVVPGKSGNPQCTTSSNASSVAQTAVTKSQTKTCFSNGDGLTPSTAGSSAYQIKRDFPTSVSGLYWIKNASINKGNPFQIYADMETSGGGWTLVVANSVNSWTYAQAQKINELNPPVDPTNLSAQGGKYSILTYADFIKKSASGFQYRMDANSFASCGGVWTSNSAYSFVSTSNGNTNINLNVKYGDWNYDNDGIEARMPWLANSPEGLLTTSELPGGGNWWGTLIQATTWENVPMPWIAWDTSGNWSSCARPSILWYWVR